MAGIRIVASRNRGGGENVGEGALRQWQMKSRKWENRVA